MGSPACRASCGFALVAIGVGLWLIEEVMLIRVGPACPTALIGSLASSILLRSVLELHQTSGQFDAVVTGALFCFSVLSAMALKSIFASSGTATVVICIGCISALTNYIRMPSATRFQQLFLWLRFGRAFFISIAVLSSFKLALLLREHDIAHLFWNDNSLAMSSAMIIGASCWPSRLPKLPLGVHDCHRDTHPVSHTPSLRFH